MWFKQLSILRLHETPSADLLAEKLSTVEFFPCMGLDWCSVGFTAPVPFSPEPVFSAQNTLRLALKREEKVLPAAVVRDIVDAKVQEIQNAEGRNVGRKEKQELKEQIIDDLLPRAFTKSSRTEAIISDGLLLINNANANKASELQIKLSAALGGLDARLPRTVEAPGSLMTRWLLAGAAEGDFVLDSDASLRGMGDVAATVRMGKQDLTAEEVVKHAESGKTVTELGLIWQDRIRFVLTKDFTFKRIQYLDVLQEEASGHGDDMASMMFASQMLMSTALTQMIDELVEYLGDWAEES